MEVLHKEELRGFKLNDIRWVLGVLRGLRNGIITGTRIRMPYIIQSLTYALLYRDKDNLNKLRFVIKQMFFHGRNLGLFVFIYKIICTVLRHFGIRGGLECWIAGYVGGYIGFGDSDGVSGAVNNQICLYLFARGLEGMLSTLATKQALILYMTDYQENHLRRGFYSTMEFLYYESNSGALVPSWNFLMVVLVVLVSYIGDVGILLNPNSHLKHLRLERVLQTVDWEPWNSASR